ncbi:MAG: hypothetical protein ACK46E_18920, partial [Pseudanabaena sp.]
LEKAEMAEPACHPGGGRVVDALADYLGDDLAMTRSVLRAHGNMSSPTVLFILKEILAKHQAGIRDRSNSPFHHGIALAFGPGLSIEGCLFQSIG